VPTIRLSCATDDENRVGSINVNTRRTPACLKLSRKRGVRPSRPIAGHNSTNCTSPAASTPQASAFGGTLKQGASHNIAAITMTLCNTGVTAGSANCRKLLSTAPASAVIEMNKR